MEAVQKVHEFLDNAKTYYLATVEGDQPRVRPYGAELFYNGKLYIMAMGETNATRQIAQNPKAEICAFKGQTLRIECKLVKDERPEVVEALLKAQPTFKAAIGEKGEKAVMYEVTEATASFFKFSELIETVKF